MTKSFDLSGAYVRTPLLLILLATILMPFSTTISAQDTQEIGTPVATKAARFDVSPPLRDMTPITISRKEDKAEDDPGMLGPVGDTNHDPDPALQDRIDLGVFRLAGFTDPITFPGIGNPVACGGCSPPDTNGDIGPNHYIQMVNTKFQIFSRAGTHLLSTHCLPVSAGRAKQRTQATRSYCTINLQIAGCLASSPTVELRSSTV